MNAYETISLLVINTFGTSVLAVAKHCNSQRTLKLPSTIRCPNFPLLATHEPMFGCSEVLLSDTNDDSLTFAIYRFCPLKQTMINSNFAYNARTLTLTFSFRRSRLPLTSHHPDNIKYIPTGRLRHTFAGRFLENLRDKLIAKGPKLYWFDDSQHTFYCW